MGIPKDLVLRSIDDTLSGELWQKVGGKFLTKDMPRHSAEPWLAMTTSSVELRNSAEFELQKTMNE